MDLEEALHEVVNSEKVISRPYLYKERHCYLEYQGLHLPLKLYNYQTGLRIDWHPSVQELWASDWFTTYPKPTAAELLEIERALSGDAE